MCMDVMREKLRYSHIEVDIYNMGRIVNALSCVIKKQPNRILDASFESLQLNISNLKNCLTNFTEYSALVQVECSNLCKIEVGLNYFSNSNNVTQMVFEMKGFYFQILNKSKGIFVSRFFNQEKNYVVLLKEHRKGKNLKFNMNLIQFQMDKEGIDFYTNGQRIDDVFAGAGLIRGLLLILILFN